MFSKLTKKQQTFVCWTNRLVPIFPLLTFLTFLILFSLLTPQKMGTVFGLQVDEQTAKNLKIFLVMLTSFGLFFNLLYLISACFADYEKYQQFKMQFLFLSFFSLNILIFFFNLTLYLYDKPSKKPTKKKSYKKKRQKFLLNLGIRKWTTYDLVLTGIFTALTIALAFFEQFLPHLSYGGGIALKYLPIIIIAFTHSSLAGVVVGATSALMSLIFIPGALIISPWSYLLDYFLPMISPAICGVFRFKVNQKTSYLDYLNYVIMLVLTFALIYLWQVLSGYFIWVAIYGPAWGNDGWIYSLIYNAIHVWIFTYPLAQLVTPPILKALTVAYQRRSR